MTLKQLRGTARRRLIEGGKTESPETEADLIVMHVLGLDKTELLTRDPKITDAAAACVNSCLNRRLSGMPIQYIIGKTEFMSLEFEVNESVLIPRQDTETLVEAVIDRYRGANGPLRILDIGCGSGCIGVSLARYLPSAAVTELDISREALDTAKRNAELNRVLDRTEFVRRDIRDGAPSGTEFDCIVSNPPYIPTGDLESLQIEVAGFEPLSALDGGADGLDFYKIITEKTAPKKGGITAFEVGINQADAVADMLFSLGYTGIEIIPDLSGIDRVVLGRR